MFHGNPVTLAIKEPSYLATISMIMMRMMSVLAVLVVVVVVVMVLIMILLFSLCPIEKTMKRKREFC